MADTASVPTRPTAGTETRAVRAFFALSPDEPVKQALAALGRDIARRSRGRSVSPEIRANSFASFAGTRTDMTLLIRCMLLFTM